MTTSSTSPRSCADAGLRLGDTPVRAAWTARANGDQRLLGASPAPPPAPPGRAVRRLRQIHGSQVVVVDRAPPPGARRWMAAASGDPPEGDAVVACDDSWVLAVLTADCAPVALGSPEGVHAAVHVGWRGIVAGVLPRAVETVTGLGASAVVAAVGPCIGPCCYEFSAPDLDVVAQTVGGVARSRTTAGRPSLDLRAAVRAQLVEAGVAVVTEAGACTACNSEHFSYRARGEEARQALLVWREPARA